MNWIREDELMHYGVLGMKCGVRRNPSRAFAKASKKATRLNNKQVSTNLKSAKLRKKALVKSSKATSEKQYQKARKFELKANKLQLKSAKQLKKGMKWQKSMEKAFKEIKVSDISSEDLDIGKRYVYMLLDEQRAKK